MIDFTRSVNVVEIPLPWWEKAAETVEKEESNLEASGKKLDNIPKPTTTASANLSYGVEDEAPNKQVLLIFTIVEVQAACQILPHPALYLLVGHIVDWYYLCVTYSYATMCMRNVLP